MDSGMSTILMLVLLLAVFYFMMIRPENKRKKAAEQMRSSLKKGDKVTTIGGIVGTVVQVNDNTLIIETSEDRVRMELTKWGISTTGVQATADEKTNAEKKELPDESSEETEEPADSADSNSDSDADSEEKKD